MSQTTHSTWQRAALPLAAILLAVFAHASTAQTNIPPAEQLLPADTLLVITAPDSAKLRSIIERTPEVQFWRDPAMKPFRDKFMTRLKNEFVVPLERDLGVKFDDCYEMLHGQLTLAITQEGWQAQKGESPAFLVLLDARDKRDQLVRMLTDLRRKWVEAGKPIKSEKIRNVDFSIVPLATNDVPKTLKPFFPQKQEIQELGREQEKKTGSLGELVVGQHESLLIVGTSAKAVEKVVARLTGGALPPLAEEAAFEANRLAVFRDAPLFGWFNARAFFDVLARIPPEEPNPLAPSPVPELPWLKLVSASGLSSLKSAAFALRDLNGRTPFEIFLGVPEATRQGVFRILSVDTKDADPPPFVPLDVVQFQRWRVDGQTAVATLEKMIQDLSASTFSSWNFVLNSGEEGARLDDPGYHLRRDLVGNLGNDLIWYEKAPRGFSAAEMESPPALLLIGSPNAEKLARALRGLLLIRWQEAMRPQEREFLGRRIFSFKIPGVAASGTARPAPRDFSYAASGGYVAISTDVATLEEYLRSSEGPKKALRETPGLIEAAQMVGGQTTGQFSYENEAESMRIAFEALRKGVTTTGTTPESLGLNYNPVTDSIPFASPERTFRDWMDFSLLPPYEQVGKYFHFTVSASSANVDGITFKYFSPTPPQLKKESVGK
jgi:hypothetical protein